MLPKKIEKGIRYGEGILAGISGVLFLGLMFLSAADVIGRYAFDRPIFGTMEISQLLMAGIVLFGLAYTQKMGGHVRVEFVISRFPPTVQTIASFVALLLSLILYIVIAYKSASIAMQYCEQHRVVMILQIPSGPFYFFVPVGAFFLCLEFVIEILRLVPEMRKVE